MSPIDPERMPDAGAMVPLTREHAEAVAAEMNAWCEHMRLLGPVPLRFNVTHTVVRWHVTDEPKVRPAVRLIAAQPTGPHVMFLTPDQADELAAALTTHAQLARTGLTLGGA